MLHVHLWDFLRWLFSPFFFLKKVCPFWSTLYNVRVDFIVSPGLSSVADVRKLWNWPFTGASSRNRAIGWISMQGYGNLTKAVGIPCKTWKSIQCIESPPGVGWKYHQVLQNTLMEIQPSYSTIHNNNPQQLMSNMKVKVNCCNPMKVKVNWCNLMKVKVKVKVNCYNPKS